jgi:hypothetical protein
MAKRALPGVELLAIKTPDQLDAARALLAAHGTANHGTATRGAVNHGLTEHNGLKRKEA